jgi:tetratricopeptide (TPR) repeat protein
MPTLSQDLALLETRGLVRVTLERAKPIVRFKHALTRQATYNSILQTRRIELHRAAAETLTALHPQPDLEMVLTIAEHWQQGNEDARALETILPHAQTLLYTGRGMSLTALLIRLNRENLNETQQRDLDIALADAHAARGEYEPARGLYERVLKIADTLSLRMRTLHGIGTSEYHLGNFARVIEIQKAHLDLAEQEQDPVQQSRALSGLGAAYIGLGEFVRAMEHFEASRALSLKTGHNQEVANAEANLAVALYNLGKFQQAIDAAESALVLDEQNGVQVFNARTLSLLGASYFGLADYSRAEYYYRRALDVSSALGDQLGTAAGLTNLAELYGKQFDLEHATETYEQAISLLKTLKQDVILCFALSQLAEIQRQQAEQADDFEISEMCIKNASKNAMQALSIAQRLELKDQIKSTTEILDAIQATTLAGTITKGA